MINPRKNMTEDARVEFVAACANALVQLAGQFGVNVRIDRRPRQPLAMGNMAPVIDVWPREEYTDQAAFAAAYNLT